MRDAGSTTPSMVRNGTRPPAAWRHATRRWLWITLLIVLASGVRFYRLGFQNFWIDEVFHVQVAAQPPTEIIRNYHPNAALGCRDQAPLSFLVEHPFLSAQATEWSARLPSALFGVCDVVAVFLVAVVLLPQPIPLVAALLLAVSPLHVWYSQEARWYAQWGVLTTLSYIALLHAWNRGGRLAWATYALVTLLGIYTFIFSLFVIACQGVTAWWMSRVAGRSRRFLFTFGAVQLGVVAAATPVFRMVLGHLDFATGTPRPNTAVALAYTMYAYAAGFTLGPPLAYLHTLPGPLRLIVDHPIVVAVFAIFLPLVALGLRSVRRRPIAAAVLIPWLCGPPLAVFALALSTNVTYQVRYSIVALPAFVITVAAGIMSLRPNWVRSGAAAATAMCALVALTNYYWNPLYGKEDVRSALAHIRAEAIGGAAVMPVGQITLAVRYYGHDLDVRGRGDCADDGHLSLPSAERPQAIWVVVGRDWKTEAAHCLDYLSRSYATVSQRRFPGVDLWLLQRRTEPNANRGGPECANSTCSESRNMVWASGVLHFVTHFGKAKGPGAAGTVQWKGGC